MGNFEGKHILIIVENLPVPFDRRVWNEASALTNAGAKVTVICPRMKGYIVRHEIIDDIEVFRHPLPLEAKGKFAYFFEYFTALFWEFILALRIYSRKRFQIIHACNPPDLIFLVALPFKLLGVKFIFDHHDINPELYIAKYSKKGIFYKFLLLAERLTFRFADYSIATNESYREIAIRRGKMMPEKVSVVRSGPDLDKFSRTTPNPAYKNDKKYLVGYVGVIGEQEGLDLLLKAAAFIIKQRNDVQFAIVGGGTELSELQVMSKEMGLEGYVTFYGRVPDKILLEILCTADVCVNPDKFSEMNDLSTMNKIMEYMAMSKPVVQFDLKEGRISAMDASLYAKKDDPLDFADKIMYLLENELLREEMGKSGLKRISGELSWEFQKHKLIQLYETAFLSSNSGSASE